MTRRRLLERVLDPPGTAAGLGRENRRSVEQSVLDSLRRIFSSGQGDASTDPMYGLPDVGAISRSMPEATERMRQAIVQAIRRYEPRLTDVEVKPAADSLGRILRFDIVGALLGEEGSDDRAFKVATRLTTAGHLVVEE